MEMIISEHDYELLLCKKCMQMTNHKDKECLKCKNETE